MLDKNPRMKHEPISVTIHGMCSLKEFILKEFIKIATCSHRSV
jgi:hypothetical protein